MKKELVPNNIFHDSDTNASYVIKAIGDKQIVVKAVLDTRQVPILKVDKNTYKVATGWRLQDGKQIPCSFVKALGDEPQDENGDRLFPINVKSTRAGDPRSVLRSLRQLEDIINCNITSDADLKRAVFVTLTYRYNTRDTEKLYADFKEFTRRIRQFLDKNQCPRHEYISVIEPQGRGYARYYVISGGYTRCADKIMYQQVLGAWHGRYTTFKWWQYR